MIVECFMCKKKIDKKPSAIKIRINNFCSVSCSNKNRRVYSVDDYVCLCGNKKDAKANKCHQCKINNTLQNNLNKQIKNVISKGNARVKYAYLRKLASNIMIYNKIKKCCYICGWDIAVQVCHIKPIHTFLETQLISEVNSIKNLVYLCPNHHTMLDKHLLCIITKI